MKAKALTAVLGIGVMALVLTACGGEQPIDVKAITAKPQAYVGRTPARCATWSTTILGK